MTLKPVQRADILADPMTADEISSFEFKRPTLGKEVDKMLSSPLDNIKDDDLLLSQESSNHSDRKRMAMDREMDKEKEKNKKKVSAFAWISNF